MYHISRGTIFLKPWKYSSSRKLYLEANRRFERHTGFVVRLMASWLSTCWNPFKCSGNSLLSGLIALSDEFTLELSSGLLHCFAWSEGSMHAVLVSNDTVFSPGMDLHTTKVFCSCNNLHLKAKKAISDFMTMASL